MDSLEDLSAKQLVQTYPLPLIDKIVIYGLKQIKTENEREVVITYDYKIYKEEQSLLNY